MEKINIAEILKDCPKGMELDCTICDNVYFDEVLTKSIKCYYFQNNTKTINTIYFNHYGEYLSIGNAKCVIFPKGKTTWGGFQRPFKDGDILTTEKGSIFIYKGPAYYNKLLADFYCGYTIFDKFTPYNFKDKHFGDISECRFATEEEKQKLFDAIKANGYKWNAETKTLEKLIEPKFKVGDRVVKKGGINAPVLITVVGNDFYYSNIENSIGLFPVSEQDDWELVPNKFDITTMKPFNKVLCRQYKCSAWMPSFFGFYNEDASKNPFICSNGFAYKYCVPHEGNEHLIGTTNDCDDYYKTWDN